MPEAPPCAYCRRRPALPEWKPFCGERCKMADLGRWLAGDYRVPGPSVADSTDPDGADGFEPGDPTDR
jgi:uncharacterized protein